MNEKTLELPKESIEGFSHFATINEKVYDVYKLIELVKTIESKIVPIEIFDANKNGKHWEMDENVRIGPSDIIDSLRHC